MPLRTIRAQSRAEENRVAAEDRCHSFDRRAAHPCALSPAECSERIAPCRMVAWVLQALPHPRLPKLLRALRVLLPRDRATSIMEHRSIPPCRQPRVPIALLSLSARENCDCFPRTPA